MTNELSKQLCELCGVESKGGYCSHRGKGCNMCIKPCDNENIIILYPDFGQPENFVKLLELRDDEQVLVLVLTQVFFLDYDDFIRSFLTALIEYLSFSEDTLKKHKIKLNQEQIEKSIREAEWKYE